MTATLTLSAFGQTVASSGSSTSAYQFGATSGYQTEGDAGLTLVGCRFYDAQVGRFITRDTYLDQKPYAYCDGDPVNRLDPSGHNFMGAVHRFGDLLMAFGIDMAFDGVKLLPPNKPPILYVVVGPVLGSQMVSNGLLIAAVGFIFDPF